VPLFQVARASYLQGMSESESLFTTLRQAADPEVAGAIERLVPSAPDSALSRINTLDFSRGLADSLPARHTLA
jgi:hypothetical protein